MSSLKSPAPTVAQLRSSLKNLQKALDPITAQSLESLTSQIEEQQRKQTGSTSSNGKLQSAQLNISLAYVILDLVWILLKTSAVDTVPHPVTNDLLRVQEYLTKVHNVSKRHEEKEQIGGEIGGEKTEEDEERPGAVDKGKVGRFLRHALGVAAKGKRTVFADDGSIQKVVEAGRSEEKRPRDDERKQVETKTDKSSEWTTTSSKKAQRQAEKELKKAAEAIAKKDKRDKKNKKKSSA